ncbi:MAG: 4-(cytidine 5'-diphospho)-2-C-methyl-D-erythritol kinase [Ruminococcaceae bacterium]|jgi:4-diphosphocytidyl-2-C-methyl-D-erythritol kinase|nr:4-(cytidine 5'-diphospho)-2-C-methyl-D-erythritol kinase [Oscillospiraceae bacterium]
MKIKAAAKINLLLDILKKLDNGYHSLFMIMQSVSCFDEVEVNLTDSGKIVIDCSNAALANDETNIAYKAAKAFFDYTKLENRGLEIKIQKNIPMAAGLAGGSADGAAVIFALNRLYEAKLSDNELRKIGVKVGADVPFSLMGGTALALNIGEILAPLPEIEDCFIVLAKPDEAVATGGAYASFDKAHNIRHPDNASMLEALANGDSERAFALVENVFEQVIDVHARPYIKDIMRKFGCKAACMSGSGPTVFGVFDTEKKANDCAEELRKTMKEVFVTTPTEKAIEIIEE